MKITYLGKVKKDEIPKSELPINAVKFKEPKNLLMLNVAAVALSILALVFVIGCVWVKSCLYNIDEIYLDLLLLGLIISFVIMIPYAISHLLFYPKEAEIYVCLSGGILGGGSTYHISKKRFIIMSLVPNLIFGFIPIILWIFIPTSAFSYILFTSSAFCLIAGAVDYMNIFNALTQMPKGSIHQLSGFNSYWYMP